MNGGKNTIFRKDVPWLSSPDFRWTGFSRKRVECLASIKPAMFPLGGGRKG